MHNAIGVLYLNGWAVDRDPAKSLEHFRQAEGQGSDKAQYNYGRVHDEGTGVPRDFAEAAKWYREAAEQGHPLGQPSSARCMSPERESHRTGPRL